MQENKDIVEKLDNHSLPIDESYWAEMEKRLQNSRRKVVPLWVWLAGTGIAASLLLLPVMRFFYADNEKVGTQMTQIERIPADEKSCTKGTQMTRIERIPADDISYKNQRKSVSSAFEKIEKVEGNNIIITNNTQKEQNIVPVKQYELKSKSEDILIAQNKPEKEKSQKKKSWQIAAAFTSNASNFSNFSDRDLALVNGNKEYSYGGIYNRPSTGLTKNEPEFEDVFQEFSEVTHLPPLSFGVMVRKNFNKHIAIETGLTYSFLQSKFNEDTEWQHRDATLKLHYIGVPFNAVAYLLNKSQWNIYFSLGGMVEKGFLLDYVQHTTYPDSYRANSPVLTVSLQDNIPELQWSLHTSLGVGYKFYRDISIYFEPRMMYYFKNNQPVSARTEMPLIVGLNAGLRFEF